MCGKNYPLCTILCFLCCLFLVFTCGNLLAESTGRNLSDIEVTINFHSECKVEGEKVTVGDIAHVSCKDRDLCDKIKEIFVTNMATPGSTIRISSDQIADILRNNLSDIGVPVSHVKGTVPVEIAITRVKGNKLRDVYARIYRDYVLTHMPWDKDEVTITDIKVGGTTYIPGKNNITYKVVANSRLSYFGNTPLSIVLLKDQKRVGSVRVIGKVNVFKPVAKTARSIKSHEVIESDDIRFVKENLADLSPDVITDPEEIIGKEAVHSFRANEIVRKRDIEEPLVIQKGDIVTILISTPGLVITSKGQALEGGRLGQVMKVKNIATRRVVLGMVKGHKTVQVAF